MSPEDHGALVERLLLEICRPGPDPRYEVLAVALHPENMASLSLYEHRALYPPPVIVDGDFAEMPGSSRCRVHRTGTRMHVSSDVGRDEIAVFLSTQSLERGGWRTVPVRWAIPPRETPKK